MATRNDSTRSKAQKGQGRTDQNTETILGTRKRNTLNRDIELYVEGTPTPISSRQGR